MRRYRIAFSFIMRFFVSGIVSRAAHRHSALLGAGAVATMVAGCASQSSREAAETVARQAFGREAGRVRDAASQIGDISSQGATLIGQDEQGRYLWSIGFKTGRVREEKTDAAGKIIVPRRGDLRDARATLYRGGVPSTSFRAAHLVFTDTPRGLMMTMTEGVQARSSDLWTTNEQIANGRAKTTNGRAKTKGAKSARVKSRTAKSSPSKSSGLKASGTHAAKKREPVLLQASRMDVDVSSRRLIAPNGVELTQGQTRISGGRLNADSELAVANLQGNVRARDPQGTLSADAAIWNWRAGRARATGHVALSHDGTTLSGARLDADTRLARGTLSGDAASSKPASSKPASSKPASSNAAQNGVRAVASGGQASASQLLYNWKSGRISARGSVSLQKDGGTLTASRVDSDDKLRVATAQGGVSLRKDGAVLTAARVTAFDNLARAEANGGVVLLRSGERLSANQATVWIAEKRAQASGDVVLVRSGDRLSAGKAIVWMAENRAQASGGVVLVRPEGRLSADNAVVWMNEKRARASGDVRLVRPDMTVRAARAEVFDAGSRATARVTASGGVTLVRDGATTRAQNVQVINAGNRATARLTATGDVRMARADLAMRAARVETAPSGGLQIITASGGVSARNKSGAVSANRVVWNEGATSQNGRVVATGNVALQKNNSTLRGARLESDTGFRQATLSGEVGGSLKPGDGTTMIVSAPRVQATNWHDAATARIVASGGVRARRANLSLRGDNLQASGAGNHAILTGNVLVRSDDGTTLRAPYVRYEKAENKIYASGGVVVNDPKRGTQRGRTLVADLNLKKATLTDVTGTFNQELFKNKKLFGD